MSLRERVVGRCVEAGDLVQHPGPGELGQEVLLHLLLPADVAAAGLGAGLEHVGDHLQGTRGRGHRYWHHWSGLGIYYLAASVSISVYSEILGATSCLVIFQRRTEIWRLLVFGLVWFEFIR